MLNSKDKAPYMVQVEVALCDDFLLDEVPSKLGLVRRTVPRHTRSLSEGEGLPGQALCPPPFFFHLRPPHRHFHFPSHRRRRWNHRAYGGCSCGRRALYFIRCTATEPGLGPEWGIDPTGMPGAGGPERGLPAFAWLGGCCDAAGCNRSTGRAPWWLCATNRFLCPGPCGCR